MDYYVKSNAFQKRQIDDNFELINFISGKSFKINAYIMSLLDKCSSKKTFLDIKKTLLTDDFTETQIEDLMSFLVTNKLLLTNGRQAICDIVKQKTSFFDVETKDLKDIKQESVVFIGIPFGQGNDVDSDCKNFPRVFRNATMTYFPIKSQERIIRKESIHNTFNLSNLKRIVPKIADIGDIFYCTGTDSSTYYQNITDIISKVCEKGNIPFVIGGDHSITYPILKSVSAYYEDFILLHFDAHADYKKSDLMNLYDGIGLNLLNHATVMNYCEKIDNLSEIIQCGVREPFEVESQKIRKISLSDIKRKSEEYEYVQNKKCNVYISFDIDYFDPTIAPGTASTIINGAFYDETFNFLADILKNKKIIGFDLVEVNPKLDVRNTTINLAMNLVLQILSHLKTENN